MQVSIRSEVFKPFWAQLYRNIGYSSEYGRYTILEPICFLVDNGRLITKCVPIDPIVYGRNSNIGTDVASFIDHERNDCIEQVLVPYILSEKYKYILLTDNELIFPRSRLPTILNYLKRKPSILKRLTGLVHYHVDEPQLSEGDRNAMTWFTKNMKLMGGRNQIGMVLSETEPEDSLEIRALGKEKFVEHLSTKLGKGKISFSGELFTGKIGAQCPIEIKIYS